MKSEHYAKLLGTAVIPKRWVHNLWLSCLHALMHGAQTALRAMRIVTICAGVLAISNAKSVEVDSGYVITFEDFSPTQVNQIMVYATRFSDYRQYEVLAQRSLDTQIHYMSDIDSKLLSYNFQQSFKDIKWDVVAQQSGNQFHFTFLRPTPIPVPFGVW